MKSIILLFIFISTVTILNSNAQEKSFKVGGAAPEFNIKELGTNSYFDLQKISGDTVVILEFWATWCSPCVSSFGHLNKLRETFQNEPVKFISVSYESEDKISKFLASHDLKTQIATDPELTTWDNYLAWAIPQTVIIDKKGNIAGFTHPMKMNEQIINDVLQGKTLTLNKPGDQPYYYPGSTKEYYHKMESGNK